MRFSQPDRKTDSGSSGSRSLYSVGPPRARQLTTWNLITGVEHTGH
jgi:hypothetical protein